MGIFSLLLQFGKLFGSLFTLNRLTVLSALHMMYVSQGFSRNAIGYLRIIYI